MIMNLKLKKIRKLFIFKFNNKNERKKISIKKDNEWNIYLK
jgi:hypothetical protein